MFCVVFWPLQNRVLGFGARSAASVRFRVRSPVAPVTWHTRPGNGLKSRLHQKTGGSEWTSEAWFPSNLAPPLGSNTLFKAAGLR